MRAALLTALALVSALAACADPSAPASVAPPAESPTEAGGFDAHAWLAEARRVRRSVEGVGGEMEMDGDPADRARALADAMAEVADWPAECEAYVDPETGETLSDPVPDDGRPVYYGLYEIGDVSETEAVVAFTCSFGAYQGSYALVHVLGDRAEVVRAPAVGLDGRPMAAATGQFSTPDWTDLADGTFTTFALARGLGDCGQLTRYAFATADSLEVREVRARDCEHAVPDDLPPPTDWPLLYSAD